MAKLDLARCQSYLLTPGVEYNSSNVFGSEILHEGIGLVGDLFDEHSLFMTSYNRILFCGMQ